MLKTTSTAIALLATLALTGCEIYFGDPEPVPRDGWRYCDETGCYWCDDYGCYPEEGDWGYCDEHSDCLAGCYCDEGICVEGGYCYEDADCPPNFSCDDRETCVPAGEPVDPPPPPPCNCNDDCDEGQQCNDAGECVPCDDPTCGEVDPRGECDGEITCSDPKPDCPEGTTPGILDGCWSGYCITISTTCVPPAPECPEIVEELICIERDDCQPVYLGVNCTCGPDCSCTGSEEGCVCESFEFAACQDIDETTVP